MTTKQLMKALVRHVAEEVRTGKVSVQREQAATAAFRDAITARIKRLIEEKRRTQRNTVTADNLNSYLDGFAAKEVQDESWGDVGKAIASGIAHAIGDGLGVDARKIVGLVKAFRRKKPAQKATLSKAPKKTVK